MRDDNVALRGFHWSSVRDVGPGCAAIVSWFAGLPVLDSCEDLLMWSCHVVPRPVAALPPADLIYKDRARRFRDIFGSRGAATFSRLGNRLYLRMDLMTLASAEYFPEASLDDDRVVHCFRERWYARHLMAMREDPLPRRLEPGHEQYRFLWLRTFHQPIAILIVVSPGTARVTATTLTGAGGYAPGGVASKSSIELTASQIDELRAACERADLSRMRERSRRGLDGARWLVEVVDERGYRVADAWSPEQGPFFELGLTFLRLGGLGSVEPIY